MHTLSSILQGRRNILYFVLLSVVIIFGVGYTLCKDAETRYEALLSPIVYDRNHVPILVKTNSKNHYALTTSELPTDFIDLILAKEDQYFYYHTGFNPLSMARALVAHGRGSANSGASTITEQLAKNLLHYENDRSVLHKLTELLYALSLEVFLRKDTILTMYANTVYLGNQVQGFETASRAYFGKSLVETTPHEQVTLLATLSHPTSRNPWKDDNEPYAKALYTRLLGKDAYTRPVIQKEFTLHDTARFELESLEVECTQSCVTTLDTTFTSMLRNFLKRTIENESARGVRNGAIVVIDVRAGELRALVGSPDPTAKSNGAQINMALEPRPIGSTIKPFIYLKGFMNDLRPYTLVDDREYRYPIATGYALYPKNFDGAYRGEVTLHTALANSLNVPSVKILEYIGLPDFYTFLTNTLTFKPIQPLESYQYGIALGGLEMDLLTLTHYFTLFPMNGILMPLHVTRENTEAYTPPQSNVTETVVVSEPHYAELVNAILSDRLTGVEQFGLKSSLNLSTPTYAVKTGTSRDFHDSWVVGYTPDFVVGVWLGNSENEPLAQVSGQSGAGALWHDVMGYLLTTNYARDSEFSTKHISQHTIENSLEWGLARDVVSNHRTLLIDDRLITSIHEGDHYELTDSTTIPLKAKTDVTWFINGTELGHGHETVFKPTTAGTYEVEARVDERNEREIIIITITNPRLP